MSINSKCKICRRAGVKLFLKGEKCFSPKCLMIRKPYPPGKKMKRRRTSLSEYANQLREKQRLKNWYNLRERQFKNYVKEVLAIRGRAEDASVILIKKLESRFDNVIFRLGFASSRPAARQMVSHGHFLINKKPISIPSYQVKKGDAISVRPQSLKKAVFQNLLPILKKYQPPPWLELNKEKFEAKILSEPSLEEATPPVDIPLIFEFYSK